MTNARTADILEIRERVSREKITHDQRAPFLDFAAILLAACGPIGTAFDKAAAKLTPDLTGAVMGLCELTAALSYDLEKIGDDRERIDATLAVIERNASLQDKVIAIVESLTDSEARIVTSEGASQSFRDVVFENLALNVSASSGGSNSLSGVRQSGAGATFEATGAGSDNAVENSTFSGQHTRVDVDQVHLRNVRLNTPDAAMEISPSPERRIGIMFGGDGKGAAVWVPAPGPRRR